MAGRLEALEGRVAAAAARAGRDPAEVTLLGVAKRVAPERVAAALTAGLRDLGENYLQEAVERRGALGPEAGAARWHFIGRLQRNKARAAAAHFDVVQTLDRASLGAALDRGAAAAGRRLDVLVQVNTSGEAQKGGVAPERLPELLDASRDWPHLRVAGLMTLPAATADPEAARPAFAALRALRERTGHPELRELSMGMSADFEVAIEEGATIIRIGTALFGPRPAPGGVA